MLAPIKLVTQMYRPICTIKTPNSNIMPPRPAENELLDPKKNHLPALNLKFLTATPNLTSNFETHKNVGYNFLLSI